MAKFFLSLISAALLAWEFYGAAPPRLDLFGLDASLPYAVFAAPPSVSPARYGETPPDILAIITPSAPRIGVEPGMSDEEGPPPADGQNAAEPAEITLTPGNGASFLKSGGVVIHNETKINVDMDKVMARKLTIGLPSADKPQILIVHTHGHESYFGGGGVIEIGERLAELLTAQGFNVIHDRARYDEPSFSGAYSSALTGITKTLKENPGIQVVIDVHRDSIRGADGSVKKPVTMVGDKKAAQMMFVVGTNNSGLPHSGWPHNLAFAVALQKSLVSETPELMRPINLRRERFNQHTTAGSLILEVGAQGNSFGEALYSIELFAESASGVLKGLVK